MIISIVSGHFDISNF